MSAKRVLFLSSLIGAILFAQDASATLLRMLPESSHYQGFVFYDEEWPDGFGGTTLLRGRIDFAVYDTLTNPDEFIGADGYTAPGDGRYIYAYQIFNEYTGFSEEAVTYFAALGIDMAFVYDIDSQEAPEDGIGPTDQYFSDMDAVWEFGEIEQDWLVVGEHSWFLAFSSDMDWSRGEYEIRGTEPSDFPVPEPAMLTLFSIGGAMLLRRGKNIFRRSDK